MLRTGRRYRCDGLDGAGYSAPVHRRAIADAVFWVCGALLSVALLSVTVGTASAEEAAPLPTSGTFSHEGPGMSEYVQAVATYDATAEALWCAWNKRSETSDAGFRKALAGFQQALAKAEDQKLKLECLYRVWRCHVRLQDEAAADKAWETFTSALVAVEGAAQWEELAKWQIRRRLTRGDWEGAAKLLEWVATESEGTELERWALDELAWVLFLPLGLKTYPEAMALCKEIIERWPDGDEARRAHYRLGMMWWCFYRYRSEEQRDDAYREEEQVRAKERFEVILQRWPDSLEAREAKVHLDQISLLLSGQKRIRVIRAKKRSAETGEGGQP